MVYEMKPVFEERMRKLMPDAEDFDKFNSIVHTGPRSFIRCNTLKIETDELIRRLGKRWKIKQLFPEHPEIILVESELGPGELGNAVEHLLGYYYIQDVWSMMSVLALKPEPGELVLDLCRS